MPDNTKQREKFNKFLDALATVGYLYPFAYILYAKLVLPPLFIVALGGVGMLVIPLAAALWKARRYTSAPRGTYPIMDLFMDKAWFRLLLIIAGIILGLSLLSINGY